MKLLIDEDSQSHRQIDVLRAAGHDVVSVAELNRNGAPDNEVFSLAQELDRVLLTHNAADFLALARHYGSHAGLIVVFRDGNPRNNMNYDSIARAVGALESAGVPIRDQVNVLNHWQLKTASKQ
jgi:predicted nuclease of predicted toxin-antitoxin system